MYWEPGWVEAAFEDFKSRQQEVINQQEWIIEGNYNNTFEMRVEKADTIIYIEKPLTVCLYRVMKRWLTNIGKDRPDRAVRVLPVERQVVRVLSLFLNVLVRLDQEAT